MRRLDALFQPSSIVVIGGSRDPRTMGAALLRNLRESYRGRLWWVNRRAAEAGERIVLTRHGKPVADLVPHQATVAEKPMSLMDRYEAYHKANPRKGIGWVADDFDDPLPEDFLLQPFPDDFDEKLAAANKRAQESRGG